MTLRLSALPLALLGFLNAAAAQESRQIAGGDASPARWSGVFAGLHAGYGRSSTNWGFPFFEYYNTAPGESFSIDPKGAFAGGHLLLNRQFGRVVLGAEGAFSKGSFREDRIGPVTVNFPEDRFSVNIDNIATISGRLGYAFDKWLVYAKGGYATAEVSHHALSGPPGEGVEAATEARQNGRIIGGGAEYMIAPMMVLGLEYSFVKLEAARHSTTTTGVTVGLPANIDSDDIALHSVTARLSIKLGERPEAGNLK